VNSTLLISFIVMATGFVLLSLSLAYYEPEKPPDNWISASGKAIYKDNSSFTLITQVPVTIDHTNAVQLDECMQVFGKAREFKGRTFINAHSMRAVPCS
jgi:hypothetical protein